MPSKLAMYDLRWWKKFPYVQMAVHIDMVGGCPYSWAYCTTLPAQLGTSSANKSLPRVPLFLDQCARYNSYPDLARSFIYANQTPVNELASSLLKVYVGPRPMSWRYSIHRHWFLEDRYRIYQGVALCLIGQRIMVQDESTLETQRPNQGVYLYSTTTTENQNLYGVI